MTFSATATSTSNTTSNPALKVLFLSSDTGGGHRASATALGVQFQRLFPNSTYHLLDITKEFARPPYNNLQSWYSHLSSNPRQWNIVYKISNTQLLESFFKIHFKMSTKEEKIRNCISDYQADVVISVHPLMNDLPAQSCRVLSHERNRHLPFFTVVTDLGSGHCTWFEKNVEQMFIASTAIERLAIERGNVPREKLMMKGLPIRYEFAFEAERLGDRTQMEGKIYQLQMRGYLGLFQQSADNEDDCVQEEENDRKVLLVMGGGEGVGSLSKIVHNLYVHCVRNNIRALILVVCGRNTKLQSTLETCDWEALYEEEILTPMSMIKTETAAGITSSDSISSLPSSIGQNHMNHMNHDSCVKNNSTVGTSCTSRTTHRTTHSTSMTTQVTGLILGPAKKVTKMVLYPLQALSSLSSSPTKQQNHTSGSSERTATTMNQNEKFNIQQPSSSSTVIHEEKKVSSYFYESYETSNNTRSIPSSTESSASSASSSSSSTTSSLPSSQPTFRSCSPLVIVKPLGFVTNMAEYMVAADLLLTKAGPGTIAEAASLGLPVLLTSFLPGQEEGNVDFVMEKKFGVYISDTNPELIAKTVCSWLNDPDKMIEMSRYANMAGMPNAAEDIVKCIGKSVLRWKELQEE